MVTARKHNPALSLDEIASLRGAFGIAEARAVVSDVGIPPLLDETAHYPEIDAAPDEMVFAQLARRLNDAAFQWGWQARQQTSASPTMKQKLADRIFAKTSDLQAVLLGDDGELLSSLKGGGLWAEAALEGAENARADVSEAVAAIEKLRRWSAMMSLREGSRPDEPHPNKIPDAAFGALLATLGANFEEFWHRAPRVSTDPKTGEPRGAFYRFAASVLLAIGIVRTPAALRKAIQRNPDLEAMRARDK